MSKFSPLALSLCLVGAAFVLFSIRPEPLPVSGDNVKLPRVERKAARDAYFNQILRDPVTGEIPPGIRAGELEHAKTLPTSDALGKNGSAVAYDWTSYGPNDIGGRTRALAIDAGNSATLVAGGVSGGIWKSTDRGATWRTVSDPSDAIAVTSLAQDTRAGHQNKWYAVTGEFSGNSASARGGSARYQGTGFFVSTDNAETWTRRIDAGDNTSFDTDFDFAARVAVSPTTGTVFICSNTEGILRSNADVTDFSTVLGGLNEHRYCDVQAAPDGALIAALSAGDLPPTNTPGLYRSTDDGVNWTRRATTLPTNFRRPVVAIAPSNPSRVYLFFVGSDGSPNVYDIDLNTNAAVDRSANLPDFGGDTGTLDTQGNYNLTLAVKPDNENFVVIGGTSLYRTFNGFETPISNRGNWINGYSSQAGAGFANYANGHPDQHVAVFDPTDPKRMYVGNDGGIQRADDIQLFRNTFPWVSLNNRYNVTQLYHVAIPPAAGAMQAFGGTQDNGTPFVANGNDLQSVGDISIGRRRADGVGAQLFLLVVAKRTAAPVRRRAGQPQRTRFFERQCPSRPDREPMSSSSSTRLPSTLSTIASCIIPTATRCGAT